MNKLVNPGVQRDNLPQDVSDHTVAPLAGLAEPRVAQVKWRALAIAYIFAVYVTGVIRTPSSAP